MIQGGGYKYNQKDEIIKINEYKSIKSEANNGLCNVKGALAMARSGDNPNSATSNFFINLKANYRYNYSYQKDKSKSYTVFGKVITGWDTIEKISSLKTIKKGVFKNYPIKDVIIKKIEIYESDF